MVKTLISLLVAAVVVVAQDNNTLLQAQAIQANFQNAQLVPSLLSQFNPTNILAVTFPDVGTIQAGQALSQDQVKPTPSVAVTPVNASDVLNGTFTIAMVDAGPVGTDETQGQTRHWLVNGISLTASTSNTTVPTSGSGTVSVTDYAGPAPPSGSGAHRYVILLYVQPSSFTPPANLSQPGVGVSVFDLNDYVQSSGLGPLVAATYLTVEEGTATFTPSPTSAVITSTLPAAQSSSSTLSSKTTGSAAGTPSASAKNAAFSTFSGALNVFLYTGLTVIAGALLM